MKAIPLCGGVEIQIIKGVFVFRSHASVLPFVIFASFREAWISKIPLSPATRARLGSFIRTEM